MKIDRIDNDKFDSGKKFGIKQIAKTGVIFATTMVMGNALLSAKSDNNEQREHYDYSLTATIDSDSLNIDSTSLNDMHIIINDSDCSDRFFSDVCDNLREDGLVFETTSNSVGIDKDNSVVITLDQQYSSGPATLIFAPYNNSRIGDSDSLALSMQAAFAQNGFDSNDILCGKVGYREDKDGNVNGFVPTEAEDAIDENNETSFVTISFGTENTNAELVSKSIENGLARQKYYLDNFDPNTDLIYRCSNGEDSQVVADYFGASVNDLIRFNKLKDVDTLESHTIINPAVSSIKAFDKNTIFTVDSVKTRAY